MIPLKIQMFSYIELAEQLVWVDKEVQSFFCCQRFSYSTHNYVIIDSLLTKLFYSSVMTLFFYVDFHL